ncbi:MAG: SEL1-like repeat protein, partial [Prevotella sp.]|nr:SEL1-like repeat protein [Prevotella sp.]
YDNGYGVHPNKAKALEWYRKAAAQGHESAQKALGVK